MWRTLQIVFVILGLLLVFVSDRLSLPVLLHAGIACLGLAAMLTGLEAIITRRLVHRRRGYRESYMGVPAILRGVQFNFAGLFLIGIALLMYLNRSQDLLLQMARRPGLLLVVLGGLSLMQAMILFWGVGDPGGSGGMKVFHLVLGRLFPGLIWLALGLTLSALGVLDALAPARFDEMGGAFLEELYGAR